MSEKLPPHPPAKAAEGHEEIDVGGYGFLIFTILFVSGLVLMSLFLVWLLRTLAAETPAEPASAVATRVLPQGPRLQASIIHPEPPTEDLARLQQRHRHLLDSYGWVDRNRRIVRIPVERAMHIYLERGAPAGGIGSATRPTSSTAAAPPGGAP